MRPVQRSADQTVFSAGATLRDNTSNEYLPTGALINKPGRRPGHVHGYVKAAVHHQTVEDSKSPGILDMSMPSDEKGMMPMSEETSKEEVTPLKNQVEPELTELAAQGLCSLVARYQVATQLVNDLEEDFNRHLAHVKANGAAAFERIREELQTFVAGVSTTATAQSSRAVDLQRRVEEARLLSMKIRELHVVTAMSCQPVPSRR